MTKGQKNSDLLAFAALMHRVRSAGSSDRFFAKPDISFAMKSGHLDLLLTLWANAEDVVSVHRPPEDFDIEEFERQADWDDFYESEELMKAHDENWSA